MFAVDPAPSGDVHSLSQLPLRKFMSIVRIAFVGAVALLLQGCAIISVVDTAVSVTSTVVSTTVDVAASAVESVAGSSSKDEPKEDCAANEKSSDGDDAAKSEKKNCDSDDSDSDK